MFFSVGPIFSIEVTSSTHIQILNPISPLSPSSSNDLVQLQSFDLDFQAAILKLAQKKCKKREWELNRVFQEVWVAKLPWAEAMVGCDGKFNMVCYKICNEFNGNENLLICRSMEVGRSARLDSLWGNILCLLTINMPRMNICGLVGVKILLLKWWLVLVKLMRRSISSSNL
jgi:hypothetical protein